MQAYDLSFVVSKKRRTTLKEGVSRTTAQTTRNGG